MKKLLICLALIFAARFACGCGIISTSHTYDGSEAYSQAHPEQSQPMPYMDPDSEYHSDDK